jgi:phospholipid/cholesterol/gamma-HCH transport system substrate-binding protein
MELGTGLFVLLGFAALGFLTTQLPGSGLQLRSAADTYTVKAKFDDIGGLKIGAP